MCLAISLIGFVILVLVLKYLYDKYGDNIYIMTNFCYTDEDFSFTLAIDYCFISTPILVYFY